MENIENYSFDVEFKSMLYNQNNYDGINFNEENEEYLQLIDLQDNYYSNPNCNDDNLLDLSNMKQEDQDDFSISRKKTEKFDSKKQAKLLKKQKLKIKRQIAKERNLRKQSQKDSIALSSNLTENNSTEEKKNFIIESSEIIQEQEPEYKQEEQEEENLTQESSKEQFSVKEEDKQSLPQQQQDQNITDENITQQSEQCSLQQNEDQKSLNSLTNEDNGCIVNKNVQGGKKKKKQTKMDKEVKEQLQKLRNRISAQKSRDNKKIFIQSIESENKQLIEQNEEQKKRIQELEAKFEQMQKKQKDETKTMKSIPMKDLQIMKSLSIFALITLSYLSIYNQNQGNETCVAIDNKMIDQNNKLIKFQENLSNIEQPSQIDLEMENNFQNLEPDNPVKEIELEEEKRNILYEKLVKNQRKTLQRTIEKQQEQLKRMSTNKSSKAVEKTSDYESILCESNLPLEENIVNNQLSEQLNLNKLKTNQWVQFVFPNQQKTTKKQDYKSVFCKIFQIKNVNINPLNSRKKVKVENQQ